MPKTPRWLPIVLAGVAIAAGGSASAAGFGSGASSAVMGQPLDFAVQVRLDAGDTLAPECVSAEVTLGDRRIPAGLVRTVVDRTGTDSARIRVLSTQTIDEPVVGVLLNAGCSAARLSRRFVVFADPPFTPPAVAASPAPAPSSFVPAFAANPPEAPPATPSAGAAPSGAEPRRAALAGDAAPREADASARPMAARERVRQAPRGEAKPAKRAQRRAADAPRRTRRAAAPPVPAVAAAPAAGRLKLEPVDTAAVSPVAVAVDQALEAVAQAASAARAAASAASASAERIATLERSVETLRSEGQANKELAAQLRERLALAERSGRWTWPLLAFVLVLTALAAWLAWRLNASERARQRVWQAAAMPPPPTVNSELTPSKLPTAPIPFVNSEVTLPAAPVMRKRPLPAWPAPAPIDPPTTLLSPQEDRTVTITKTVGGDFPYDNAMARTEVLAAEGTVDETAPRDVSIEELIDLEQQAEFFVVLGQDDAAIELLVEHLRNTGGGSPLPYLKLLEIYRRRGDRPDYERMRTRFNHRFNAYAPEWEADLQHGRTLDTYAGVIPRLQQVWARPLDAMAELEALLFRKSRGELFDLPAYREVLFLYSLARDLLDREAADTGNVDLLLPLADGSDFSSTAPVPYLGLERDEAGLEPHDDRPTAPVDFDLTSDSNRPTSLFGPLDGEPEHPRRR